MVQKQKGEGGIHFFLSFDPDVEPRKLKLMPSAKGLTALTVHTKFEAVKKSLGQQLGMPVTSDAQVNPRGYHFAELPGPSGTPLPYLYAYIYDKNGATSNKKGAPAIGLAFGYPLEYWPADASGIAHLPLPLVMSSKPGKLIVWQCLGDRVLWVDTAPWPGTINR